jgi:hypothetical protein
VDGVALPPAPLAVNFRACKINIYERGVFPLVIK